MGMNGDRLAGRLRRTKRPPSTSISTLGGITWMQFASTAIPSVTCRTGIVVLAASMCR
jgi:hypothetical protein